jgi:hypothetical protein
MDVDADATLVGQLVSLGLGREMATLACGATGNQGLSAAVKWASQWFQVVLAHDAPQIKAVPPHGAVAVPSREKRRDGSRAPGDEAKLPANVISAIARKLENEEYMTSILGFGPTIPSSRQPPSAAPGQGIVDMGVFREAVSSPRERQIAVRLTWKGTVAGRIPPRAQTPRLSSQRSSTPLAHTLHRQDVERGKTGRIDSTGPPTRSPGRKLRMGTKTTPRDIHDDKQKTLISNVFTSTLTQRLLNFVPLTSRTVTPCSAPETRRPMSARQRDSPISARSRWGCEMREGSTGAPRERRHLTMQDRPKNCSAPPSLADRSSEVEVDSRDKRGVTMVDYFQRLERRAAHPEKPSSLKATMPRLHEDGPSHVPVQLTALKSEVASLRAELQAFVNMPAPEGSARQSDKNVAETSMARFGKKKVGMCYDGIAIAQDIVDNQGVSFT